MIQPVIIELLKNTQKYYPIGMPFLYEEYDGYKMFKEKLEKKVNQILAKENTSWVRLVENVRQKFSLKPIFDYSYLQFPSYIMNLELKKNDSKEIEYTKSLVLNISLLVNYYTLFFEDIVKVKKGIDEKGLQNSPYFRIVYFNKCIDKDCFEIAYIIKKISEEVFEEYKFIQHDLLLNNKVQGGNIYGDMRNEEFKEYSLYEYLFSNDSYPNIILD